MTEIFKTMNFQSVEILSIKLKKNIKVLNY